MDKKGEKITKFQVQIQTLTEKLKEEELIRKKASDKSQELLSESNKKIEMIR